MKTKSKALEYMKPIPLGKLLSLKIGDEPKTCQAKIKRYTVKKPK